MCGGAARPVECSGDPQTDRELLVSPCPEPALPAARRPDALEAAPGPGHCGLALCHPVPAVPLGRCDRHPGVSHFWLPSPANLQPPWTRPIRRTQAPAPDMGPLRPWHMPRRRKCPRSVPGPLPDPCSKPHVPTPAASTTAAPPTERNVTLELGAPPGGDPTAPAGAQCQTISVGDWPTPTLSAGQPGGAGALLKKRGWGRAGLRVSRKLLL